MDRPHEERAYSIADSGIHEAAVALRSLRRARVGVGERRCSSWWRRASGRTQPVLVLLDSRGRQLTSEEIANFLEYHQSHDTQELLFAVGPADGWSDETRSAAKTILSFGKITLPHELARVVLLEQLYRGFTILKGHPYHGGH